MVETTLAIANHYGNVDLVDGTVPKGYVHIEGLRLQPLCRKLGIKFAPALTGFRGDSRYGYSPIITGVIVTNRSAPKLRAEIEAREQRTAKAKARNAAEAEAIRQRCQRDELLRQVRLANYLDELGLALLSVNRHAHRSSEPGLCKYRLQLKNTILRHVVRHLMAIHQQVVNDRPCVVLQLGDTEHSFHCPIDRLPMPVKVESLPTREPLTKATWDEPPLTWDVAIKTAELIIGTRLPRIIAVCCDRCQQVWRYDLDGSADRPCPDCYEDRHGRREWDY